MSNNKTHNKKLFSCIADGSMRDMVYRNEDTMNAQQKKIVSQAKKRGFVEFKPSCSEYCTRAWQLKLSDRSSIELKYWKFPYGFNEAAYSKPKFTYSFEFEYYKEHNGYVSNGTVFCWDDFDKAFKYVKALAE